MDLAFLHLQLISPALRVRAKWPLRAASRTVSADTCVCVVLNGGNGYYLIRSEVDGKMYNRRGVQLCAIARAGPSVDYVDLQATKTLTKMRRGQ